MSTAYSSDMLIGFSIVPGIATFTVGSGFTNATSVSQSMPAIQSIYKIVSSTQTNVKISTTTSVAKKFVYISDAIQQASSTSGLALDLQAGVGGTCATGTVSNYISILNNHGPDVVFLVFTFSSTTLNVTAITDSGSHVWNLREQLNQGTRVRVMEFWTIFNSPHITPLNETVTFAGGSTGCTTQEFAISGS